MSSKMYVASDTTDAWKQIDFKLAEKCVKKLQKRIARAYSDEDYELVSILQNKMIHSFYAKALSVKYVTSKKGAKTPGVDGKLCISSEDKYNMIFDLKHRGYKPLPLKRVYIPKNDGTMRAVSIPTVKDRIMQMLYKLAIEPIAELTADESSFGYLHNKSAEDAILHCMRIMFENPNLEYVIKTDVKSCFDDISHEWILNNIPFDKRLLKSVICSEYIEDSCSSASDVGIPQGGCLSPVICNMALDGLESVLFTKFGNHAKCVRYADDIIIFVDNSFPTPFSLRHNILPTVKFFLSERGLSLSQKKTYVVSIHDSFCFLGFEVHKLNNRIKIKPTDENIISLKRRIEDILKGGMNNRYFFEWKLEQIIRGWFNYYSSLAYNPILYDLVYEITELIIDIWGDELIAKSLCKLSYSIIAKKDIVERYKLNTNI